MTRIAIVEGLAQAEALLQRGAEGYEIVAVGAEAEYRLEQAGFKSLPPEAFYEAEECRAVKEDSLARVERLLAELDRRARAGAWAGMPGTFAPFAAQLFAVRHLVDNAFFTVWRLRRIAQARPGAKFFCFDTHSEPLADDLLFRAESMWSRAAMLALPGVEAWPGPRPPAPPLKARLKSLARALRDRLRAAKPVAAVPAGSYVFLSRIYSAGLLGEEARRRGAQVVYVEPAALEGDGPAPGPIWRDLPADLLGDVAPLVLPRLRHLVEVLGPRSVGIYRRAEKLMSAKPKAVVAANVIWREKLVAQACRAAGVPFVVYVHGNIGARHSELIYHNDMAFTDLYLVNGEINAEYCRRTFPGAHCRTVAVGSAVMDRMVKRLNDSERAEMRRILEAPEDRPLVIYALSAVRDFRFPQYHRTSHANFLVQRKIAELFAKHPGVELRLKLFGEDVETSPIAAFVRKLGAPNVRVIDRPPLNRLLPAADGFVADHPSTTVVEMALTDKPIWFVDAVAHLDWVHPSVDVIRKRCKFIDTLEELDTKLGADLAARRFEKNLSREYAEGFGFCKADGKSLERAWEAVSAL